MSDVKDLRFGKAAVESGLVSSEQVDACLKLQVAEDAAGKPRRSLRQILVEEGHLKAEQVMQVESRRPPAPAGKRVGPYELLENLGEGGMGAVYHARHSESKLEVALKLLPPELAEPAVAERFKREIEAGRRLHHPNLVRTLDFGVDAGIAYLVQELVDGGDLNTLLAARGRLPEQEALKFARDIAKGLAGAHAQGLIHRDVKPSNILLTKQGQAKLADFGLVKILGGGLPRLSKPGTPIGSPYYLSPEQAGGAGEVDARADLYSLGATLYHLLTGRPPFMGATAAEVLKKHAEEPLVPPNEINHRLSSGCVAVVRKMLAKRPDERYASAESLITDLEAVLAGELAAGAELELDLPADMATPAVDAEPPPEAPAPPPAGPSQSAGKAAPPAGGAQSARRSAPVAGAAPGSKVSTRSTPAPASPAAPAKPPPDELELMPVEKDKPVVPLPAKSEGTEPPWKLILMVLGFVGLAALVIIIVMACMGVFSRE